MLLLKRILSSYLVQNYQKILPYVRPYKGRAIWAILLTIPVGSMDAVIAWALKPYMDIVMIEQNTSVSSMIPLMIIIFSLIQSLLSYSATYLNSWIGAKITNDIKLSLFKKLIRYDAAFFDKTTSGNIQFRFNNDVETACSELLKNFKMFASRIFASISLIIVLFYNSWPLAIVATAVLATALMPLTRIRKKISEIAKKSVFSNASIATHFNESFNGNRIISSYNLHQYQQNKFSETLSNVFTLGMKIVQKTGILSPIMHFIIASGVAIIIWLGSYLIVNHSLTPGGFISFITALLLLYQPIKSISNDFHSVQMALLALDRVFEMLSVKSKIFNNSNAHILCNVKHKIKYKNVCFSYADGKNVLNDINLDIDVGETVAFVGNSGGGKSTIVNLLPRFYEIQSGSITIDDINIKDIQLDSLRDQIAVVFQDNFLFTGTIRENIVLGNQEVKEDDLQLAIKSACLDEFIDSLELGINTQVGEKGVLLSGGQKQRIAIARAFIKNAPIVILDEATSALDNKSEFVVQQAINNLMSNRTVLVIAHRLSTIKNADKIVLLNNGNIIEVGTHDKLIQNKKEYYSLYQASEK